MLDQLLGPDRSALIASMASMLGGSKEQAEAFVAKAIAAIQGAFDSGRVDFDRLLKGDLSGLTGGIDMQALSEGLGGDVQRTQQAVAGLLQTIQKQAESKGLDADALMKQFGGGGGLGNMLGGLVGKFLGKG